MTVVKTRAGCAPRANSDWSESVFFNSLDTERPEQDRRDLVDRFYQSYVDLVRDDPAGHAMDYVHIYMVLSKI